MNLTQLYERTEYLADLRMSNVNMLASFNAFQRVYADYIYKLTKVELTKSGGIFTIPSNYIGGMLIVEPENVAGETVKIYGTELQFDGWEDTDTCTIEYQASVADIANNPDAVPDIPLHLHEIYPIYAVKMAMVQDDEPERYQIISYEFNQLLKRLQKYYAGIKSKRGVAGAIKVAR